MPKTISVIVPLFNEEKNIPLIYAALTRVFSNLPYGLELIFVNDGSSDRSGAAIERLKTDDKRIVYLEFTRNFGKEAATSAGIHRAQGEAAILIDADLQHPPEVIPDFIRAWEGGCDMVVGVRELTEKQRLSRKLSSALFYKLVNILTDLEFIPNSTDFRLIDRMVIDEFNRFTEHNRITRGLLDWLGFRKCFVKFTAGERANGEAAYGFFKLLRLAMATFVGHSLFPLKFAGYLGLLIVFLSGPFGLFIFIEKYLLHDPFNFNFSGPAILAVIILFLVGIILSCLGLIALYIGNIQTEVINRPVYVARTRNTGRPALAKENQACPADVLPAGIGSGLEELAVEKVRIRN